MNATLVKILMMIVWEENRLFVIYNSIQFDMIITTDDTKFDI